MKSALLSLFLFASIALGATNGAAMEAADDFSPMCFALALALLCVVLLLVGIGFIIAGIIAVSGFCLVALGIVSSAAVVGILRRRFSSGLRAFHYLIFAAVCLPGGIGTLWLASHVFSNHLCPLEILAIGSLAGICGGLILAFAFDRVASIVYHKVIMPLIPNATGNP